MCYSCTHYYDIVWKYLDFKSMLLISQEEEDKRKIMPLRVLFILKVKSLHISWMCLQLSVFLFLCSYNTGVVKLKVHHNWTVIEKGSNTKFVLETSSFNNLYLKLNDFNICRPSCFYKNWLLSFLVRLGDESDKVQKFPISLTIWEYSSPLTTCKTFYYS